jgi:hypothetical protein
VFIVALPRGSQLFGVADFGNRHIPPPAADACARLGFGVD